MIRCLLLDLGEVVLRLDFATMVRGFGFGEATDVGEALRLLNREKLYDDFERGALTELEFRLGMERKLGRQFEHADFLRLLNSVIIGPVPGADVLLERLSRRLPVCALSNTNESHIRFVLDEYPWMKHFRKIYASHDLKARKPEPEIYRKVITDLGFLPEQILFIDDRPENVRAAVAEGMRAEVCRRSPEDLIAILGRYGLDSVPEPLSP